ncbi:MAG: IS1 family transposase, partial [Microcystis aeruginosa Ma_SC_T_19800800_S464]
KETGQTNHIERLNNTFRQRISRLVRESLSFSKKMENHVGKPFSILSMTAMHSKAKD